MGLETAAFVSNLVATNPVAGDTKSQGDDHLRLIKGALQATFPNASKAFYFPDSAAKTIAYTVVAADMLKFLTGDATAGAFAFTLPTLAVGDAGWQVAIMKIDASVNAVTITGTVNGSANPTLTRRYEAAILWWTGTAWFMARQRPAIDTADITLLAVTTALINDLAVTTAKIADLNVTTAKIADNNITTAKIADGNVTNPKLAGPRMTMQVFLSGTAATYTTPANCKNIRIRMIAGGGGGGGTGGNGGVGGTTTFNLIDVAGGSGGTDNGVGGIGGTGGAGSATLRIAGADGHGNSIGGGGSLQNGMTGGAGVFGGAGRAGTAGKANSGGGGGGGWGSNNIGSGGGSGEYAEILIASPSATYTYTVGAGGTAGSGGTPGAGGTGIIIVEEFY